MTSDATSCPACLNGCGFTRSDCPMKGGVVAVAVTGRPSSYSEATAARICALLAEGEPMRAICEKPGMPHQATVYRWLEAHEAFRERYARAREVQGHVVAERGYMEAMTAGEGLEPAAARVRFDAARWLAGKLAPKVYGDKVTQEHTGPGGGPVQLTWGDGSTS